MAQLSEGLLETGAARDSGMMGDAPGNCHSKHWWWQWQVPQGRGDRSK